jgi:uncharacterized glyoxalase superfamily protein PhnB
MAALPIAPTITPSLPYDDVAEAIRWLARVLGFTVAAAYDGPDGGIVFAQLVWRTGVVLVSARAPADNPWALVGPASIALAAEDAASVDRQYQRAVAAGAQIVRPPHLARTAAFPDGSHQFDVRDPGATCGPSGPFGRSFPPTPSAVTRRKSTAERSLECARSC